jgi:uncharacterized protein YkwD
MERYGYFSHKDRDGDRSFERMTEAGVKWRSAAENIAHGQKTSTAVISAWMKSPGHRKNMLNPKYGRFGIGMADYYWVLDLAD